MRNNDDERDTHTRETDVTVLRAWGGKKNTAGKRENGLVGLTASGIPWAVVRWEPSDTVNRLQVKRGKHDVLTAESLVFMFPTFFGAP